MATHITEAEKIEIKSLAKAGYGIDKISRKLNRSRTAVRRIHLEDSSKPGRKFITEAEKIEIKSLAKAGYGRGDISRKLNRSYLTIYNVCRDLGITTKPGRKFITEAEESEIKSLFKAGYNKNKISIKLGINPELIRRVVRIPDKGGKKKDESGKKKDIKLLTELKNIIYDNEFNVTYYPDQSFASFIRRKHKIKEYCSPYNVEELENLTGFIKVNINIKKQFTIKEFIKLGKKINRAITLTDDFSMWNTYFIGTNDNVLHACVNIYKKLKDRKKFYNKQSTIFYLCHILKLKDDNFEYVIDTEEF